MPPPTANRSLRRYRKRAGLTAAELAARAGISREMVHRIESGTRHGSDTTLTALAVALGVPAEAIGGPATDEIAAS